MSKFWTDIAALGILFMLVAVFFFRLFYPEPQLLVTPDFGRSDAWHFSFATKFALKEALDANTLPLWRNDIGDGFPLFAEGQIGTLFIPNLILFKFFDPVTAYNLALALAVATLGLGMYWLTRTLKLSPLASLFCAVTATFSGMTITNLTHITLLQSMSVLPIIMTLSLLISRQHYYPWAALLAFTLSQQLFAGFPQASFLTVIISVSFVLWETLPKKKYQPIILWFIFVSVGVLASAAQFLPSYEFLHQITDPAGFSQSTATAYSMPIKHLVSFVAPFVLGHPKFGTYPPFYQFDGSIFWENTAYIGIIPTVFLILSLFIMRKKKLMLFLWCIVGISIVLAAGKYSPAYVIFSFWPFNLFRVPSRFLWLTIIAITLIAGLTVNTIRNKKMLIPIVLLHAFLLLTTFWSYHLIEPASVWLTKPTVAERIQGRVVTFGEGVTYNNIMTSTGWQDGTPYRFLKNGLSPDSNMLWGIQQHNVYAGRQLKRPSVINSLLSESIISGENSATISATKFLNLFSIANILSFVPIDAPDVRLVSRQQDGKSTLSLYSNTASLPRAYLVFEATTAATLQEAITILRSDAFVPGRTVLLEEPSLTGWTSAKPAGYTISWKRDTHTDIELLVNTSEQSLLVLTDTYYPGWQATIDGRKTQIYAANLSQRAVMIPQGSHTVSFSYQPLTLAWGIRISTVIHVIIVLLIAVPRLASVVRTPKMPIQPASDP